MAYDEDLAHRIREQLADEAGTTTEIQMFGGLSFLLDGSLALWVGSDGELMARIGADAVTAALAKPHVRPADQTGQRWANWIVIEPEGIRTKRQLAAWVTRAVACTRSTPKRRRRSSR